MPADRDQQTHPAAPDGVTVVPELDGPIAMIRTVARQIAHEAGLTCTADLQHLVLIAYLGLLDSPPPQPPATDQLLRRCRQNLIIWAWEQGRDGEQLAVGQATTPPSPPPPAADADMV